MCDKISVYILKIVKKDPFLRLQMRAKEMFIEIPINCLVISQKDFSHANNG